MPREHRVALPTLCLIHGYELIYVPLPMQPCTTHHHLVYSTCYAICSDECKGLAQGLRTSNRKNCDVECLCVFVCQALVESNELPQKPEPVKEEEEPKEEE